jgi:hypothetical protein
MKKLVCVVEGRGDVLALPNLCSRVRDYVKAWKWIVDPNPVRQPRSAMVDESRPSPRRTARAEGITRAVELALQRPADGIVIACDADDDCPAVWGPSSRRLLVSRCPGDSVMIEREYEAWLLYAFPEASLRQHNITNPESVRDAKGNLRRLVLNQAIARPRNCIRRGIGSRAHEGLLRVRPDSFPRRVLM